VLLTARPSHEPHKALLRSVACLVVMALHVNAHAQEVLRASPLGPPSHLLNSKVLKGWADAVAEATSGRVRVEILSQAVAPPLAVLAAVRAGKADVSIMSNGASRTPLPLNALVEFAGQTPNAECASVAYQRVVTRYPALADEFAGVEVLSVFTHGPGVLLLASRDAITAAGLPDVRLHAGGAGAANAVRSLGAEPIVAPGPGAKPLLAEGKVEGTVTSAEAIDGFGLMRDIKQVVTMPGGFYSAGFSLIVNRARWATLSPEDRAAITRISGETLARMAGRAWDTADSLSLREGRARDMTITEVPKALEQRILASSEAREKAWASAQGVLATDATNALAEYRDELNGPAAAVAASPSAAR
jgi:TRAP-type C4-dicarboxylate transport system substrate-binding protein